MSRRYTFLHLCGHVGIGPILHVGVQTDAYGLTITRDSILDTIQLPLYFPCPFCSDTELYDNVEPGSGVLAVLSSAPDNLFVTEWEILRVCNADEITSHDWEVARDEGGMFRHMAWIPKPCGRVYVSSSEEPGMGGVKVESTWTQSLREPVRSRLPGMLSELSATLRSGEGNEL